MFTEERKRRGGEGTRKEIRLTYSIRKVHHWRRHPPSPYHNKHSAHHNNDLPTLHVRMRLRRKKDEQRMLMRCVVGHDGVEDCVCAGVCAVALRECSQLRKGRWGKESEDCADDKHRLRRRRRFPFHDGLQHSLSEDLESDYVTR